MDATAGGGFLRFFREFEGLEDPRAGGVTHRLHEMVVVAILGVICGCDGWAQVELFGRRKLKWLRTFLDLPGGVPSHDTFGRVFARLDPDSFERCFLAWASALVGASGGRLVAVDGKSIRRSFGHAWDKSGMAHLVSAFVAEGGNRLVFAQVAVEDKENEIVAIPRLLALLDLAGATVTVDAIGCQREVAGQVVGGGGDYVLPAKENQPTLLAKARAVAEDAVLDHGKGVAGSRVGYHEERGEAHGQVETRRVWVTDRVEGLGGELLGLWPGLAAGAVAVVERVRQDLGDLTGAVTTERHYFITSVGGLDARRIAHAVRGHWGVENGLHWQLDVTFREDDRRIRKGHGAENFSRLCRIALNLLKRDATAKGGIQTKRLQAGWDNDYLLQLISQ